MSVIFERVTEHAPWAARGLGRAIEFNGRLIIAGGRNAMTYLADAWESGNGVDWTQVGGNIGPISGTGLCSFGMAVHNRRLYIADGLPGHYNEVASSLDGIRGTLDVVNAPFTGRYDGELCSYDQRLWLIGGCDAQSHRLNDVWYTRNGHDWTQVLPDGHAQFLAREDHSLLVHGGQMWIVGGLDDNDNVLGDVLYTHDGSHWTMANPAAIPQGVYNHRTVEFDGRMVLIAGSEGQNTVHHLWHSLDGVHWEGNQDCEFSIRTEPQVAVFDNRIYVMGGEDNAGNALNDVWRTVGNVFADR
jgi:hypothetical protein